LEVREARVVLCKLLRCVPIARPQTTLRAVFHEREVVRSQRIFGGIAHVLSAYETKQSEQAREPFARGVNSLQLIREPDGWRVLSLLWDEEGPNTPLVLEHLFDQGSEPWPRPHALV